MFSADALQEMLFQMKDGKIRLFPAVPKIWTEKTGFFLQFPRGKKESCAVRRFLRAENCHGRFIQRIPYIFRYNIRRGFAEKKDLNRDSGGKSR